MIQRLRTATQAGRYAVPYGLAAAVAGLALGFFVARGGHVAALAVVAIVGLMIFFIRPINVAIVALLAVYAVQRLGAASVHPGSSGGITYSDALLAVAAGLALLSMLGAAELSRLTVAFAGTAIYLSTLLPTVFLHDTGRGELEWFHRVVLVAGALLVGAWIARERAVDRALGLLVLVSVALSVAAVANSARHYFAPASPFGMDKNFLGAQLGAVLVLLLVAPGRVGMPRRARRWATFVVMLGLFATHSRGAVVAVLVAMLVALVLGGAATTARARLALLLFGVVVGTGVYLTVVYQLNSGNLQTNALGVRSSVEQATRAIWRTSPITGVGLKYYNTGEYGYFAQAPNNSIDNELAESGVIGAAGYVVLQATVIGAGLRRRRDPLALAGGVIVLGFAVHGLVDIYWSAGVAALPFIVLGMGLAEPPGTLRPAVTSAASTRTWAPLQESARGKTAASASAMT